MTITTHSTLCETTRDRLRSAIDHVREDGLTVPRAVLAINLREEDIPAETIAEAVAEVNRRLSPDTYNALDNLSFHLSEALAEVVREPRPGGRSKPPTFPNGHPEAGHGNALALAIVAFVVLLVALACSPAVSGAHAAAREACTVVTWAGGPVAICGADTCATVNNVRNVAAWVDHSGRTQRATYRGDDVDRFGRLAFDRPVPRSVRLATARLTTGGPAIARACTFPVAP